MDIALGVVQWFAGAARLAVVVAVASAAGWWRYKGGLVYVLTMSCVKCLLPILCTIFEVGGFFD
jgi:hypothetical protein